MGLENNKSSYHNCGTRIQKHNLRKTGNTAEELFGKPKI